MSVVEIQKRLMAALPHITGQENIRRLSLFGSQARGDAASTSDIDLLIEFATPVGFFTMARIERDLSESLGAPVDLVTHASLSKYFRDDVLARAQPLYER